MDFAPDVGWRWILCFDVIKIGKRPLEKQYVLIPYGVRKIPIFIRNRIDAYMGDGIDFFADTFEQCSKPRLFDRGDYTTQLYGDYFNKPI